MSSEGDANATIGVNTVPFQTGIQALVPAASDAATKSARAMTSAYDAEFGKIVTIGAAAARRVGGEFGALGTDISRVIKPLTMIAPELGAIGAAAVAVGGTALALQGMATSAVNAERELDKLGVHFDPEARANLEAYTKASQQLQIVWDETKVSSGSGIALALATIDTAFATDIGTIERWLGDAVKVTDQIKAMETAIPRAAGLMASPLSNAVAAGTGGEAPADMMTTSTMTAAEAQKEYNDALLQHATVIGPKETAEINEHTKALEKSTQQDKLATSVLQAHDLQAATATQQLTQLYDQLHREQLGPEGQIISNMNDQIAKIDELASKGADQVLVQKALNQAYADGAKKIHDYHIAQDEMFASAKRYWDDFTFKVEHDADDLAAAVQKADRKITQGQIEMYRHMGEVAANSLATTLSNISAEGEAQVSIYQQQIESGKQLSAWQQQAANDAINRAEAAAIASAGIQAGVVFESGLASMQLLGIPPFVAAGLATAEAASSFAAAVAGIRAHTPPRFDMNLPSGDTRENGQGQAGFDPTTGVGIGVTKPDVQTGDDAGVGMGSTRAPGGKGSVSRTRGGGPDVTVGIDPASSRLVLKTRRPGKRDPRGRR